MNVSKQAASLFARAMTVRPEEREQWIQEACGADLALRDELRSLLDAAPHADGFFDNISGRVSLTAIADEGTSLPEEKMIGPWRLVRIIGRGGMGAVYLAERADGQFDQQAAVKILPFGFDGQSERLRFLAERQILAQLSHDGIARLLDGGVTGEGAPYFVMEFIDGVPIDAYCDEQRLDIRARIRLFLSVLAAVSHAHAHLIVHRDIKPSNVLVTGDGSVKLLDFGIAKVLSGETRAGQTRDYGVALTPEFAAPEQFVGGDITTGTDIYSLGLLLYSLLAGSNPREHADAGSIAALQALATQDLPRLSDFATDDRRMDSIDVAAVAQHRKTSLSALKRNLRGDLDNILQKALQFDAADRYISVRDFAADLGHYLDDEPVTARPSTATYRIKKYVRRNRGGVLAASLTLIVLFASTIITAWQMLEAKQQRDFAMQQQQQLQASNEFYGALMEEMGTEPFTTVELLDRGRNLLSRQFGTGKAFVGPLLFDVSIRYGGLRERAQQEALLLEAEIVAREFGDDNLLATVLCNLQDINARGNPDKARLYASQGNAVYSGIVRPALRASMECLRMRSRLAEAEGDIDGALAHLSAAENLLVDNPLATAGIRGPLLSHISHLYYNAARVDEAIAYVDKTLNLLEANGLGNSLGYLRVSTNKAVALQSVGRLTEGLTALENVIGKMRNSGYEQRGLASLLGQYGDALVRVGRIDEAESAYREGLVLAESIGNQEEIAAIRLGLASVYSERQEYDLALASIDAAQEYYLRDANADRVQSRMTKARRTQVLRKMGRIDDAVGAADALLAEVGYPQVRRGPILRSAVIEAAEAHRAAGNLANAERLASDLIGRLEAAAGGDTTENVDVGRAYLLRGSIRVDNGDRSGARDDVEVGLPIIARGLGNDHAETHLAKELLANL